MGRNCLPKYVIEGKIEGKTEEEEDVSSYWITLKKERYWKLKDEALWRTPFVRGYGRGVVVRQTAK